MQFLMLMIPAVYQGGKSVPPGFVPDAKEMEEMGKFNDEMGKALKIIGHPERSAIPIWVAALGEKNVAMTAEVADGWLPLFFVPEKAKDVFGASLAAGWTGAGLRI